MFTSIGENLTSFSVLESSVLPDPETIFYPSISSDSESHVMLSEDKVTSCEGYRNSTSVSDNPGATIASPLLLSLAGIAGHITALCYLHRTTKPSQHRTVFYVLLTTLIWTDFIGKVITTPPAIMSYVSGSWVGGMGLCNFHGFSMMSIDMVTHFLVAAMALDRFLCVRHGYFYKSSVTKSRTRVVLMTIWAFTLTYCAMPLFGLGEYEAQYPGTWCFINLHGGPHTPWYHRVYTNTFGFLNIFNILIILICNMIVIGTLISARMSRDRKLSAVSRHTQRSISITTQRELEIQMSIVLLVITLVFLVSWSPMDFRLFLNQIWPHTCREEHEKDLIAVRLASFNQIIDPWAYIICRRVFTSKIWRSCRSIVLGRSFSSKRHHLSTNVNPLNKDDIGGSTKVNIQDSPAYIIKRKLSLPTPEKCKIFSKVSFHHVNELTSSTKKSSDPGHYVMNSNYGNAKNCSSKKNYFFKHNKHVPNNNYAPLEKIDDVHKICTDVVIPINDYFSAIPCTAINRRQFRIKREPKEDMRAYRDKKPLVCHSYTYTALENSLTESERDESGKCNSIIGRRHSWNCSPSTYKYFISRTTQTTTDI